MNRAIKKIAAVATAGLLIFGTAACASRPATNEIYLYYTAGAGEDRKFEECIDPGKSGSYPVDDELFSLPTDKRTWNIQPAVRDAKGVVIGNGGADSNDPIVAGSLPKPILNDKGVETGSRTGPAVNVWLTTDFYLNWDCDTEKNGGKGDANSPVVQFFDRTGRTAQISDAEANFSLENWRKMLRSTVATVEFDAIQAETRKFDADALDANTGDVYAKMEAALGPAFQRALIAKMGGEYFCGVEFAGGREVTWTERVLDPATGQIVDGYIDPKTSKLVPGPRKGSCPPVRIDITAIDMNDPAIAAARTKTYITEQDGESELTAAKNRNAVAAEIKRGGPGAAEIQRQQNALELEKERTRQVDLCRQTTGAVCIVGGAGTGVNVNAR